MRKSIHSSGLEVLGDAVREQRQDLEQRLARQLEARLGGVSLRGESIRWRGQDLKPRPLEQRLGADRSEEHTSELQSLAYLVCRLLLEKKKMKGASRADR